MLIQILTHTPIWVFALFFGLLALGYYQSKSRMLSRGRALVLPVAMILLSLVGVISAFGLSPVGLAFWTVGVTAAVALGVKLTTTKGVSFSAEKRSFFVPGSWIPMIFIMAIFFTKYVVGAVSAMHLPFANGIGFVATISFCYGLFSGVFLARAIVLFRFAMQHPESHA